NAFESLEYDPVPGGMLDDIDDAKPALKNMKDTISAGNRVPGFVFARVRIVLMFPGFAETITVTAKPAQDHSATPQVKVNRNPLANQPPPIDFKRFCLSQAATIEGATRRLPDRVREVPAREVRTLFARRTMKYVLASCPLGPCRRSFFRGNDHD